MVDRAIPVLLQVLMITHGVVLKTHEQNKIAITNDEMVIRGAL
jgi:siderophore synthetase component